MKNIKEKDIIKELEEASKKMIEKDFIKNIPDAKKEKKIKNKAEELDLKRFIKLFNQIKLALSMLKDYRTGVYIHLPWKTISLIIFAIFYFWNPFDIVPDIIPILGFSDDAITFTAVFKAIQSDIIEYARWKNYPLKNVT